MNQLAKVKNAASAIRVRPMSTQVAEVRQNINLIHEAMKATMKKNVHFGTIPGCQKPSLYKPGAEVILALFKLATDPIVTDLSKDGEIRYQVKVNITTRDGQFIGSGIGECSSGEEKYSWRKAVSDDEFADTPEHLKRIKYKPSYTINQVRVNPSDMANTILKMSKKRAMIDAVLTSTGASDIFSQDIEELPEGFIDQTPVDMKINVPAEKVEEVIETIVHVEKEVEETPATPERKPQERPKGDVISEPQRKRLYAIAMGAGMEKDYFKEWLMFTFDYASSKDILRSSYEEICSEAESWKA